MASYPYKSEQEIRKILAGHNSLTNNFNILRTEYISNIKDVNDMFESVLYKNYDFNSAGGVMALNANDPVFHSYLKAQKLNYKEKIEAIQEKLKKLELEEAAVDRIVSAYHRTITICPVGYRITYELMFLEATKRKCTWESLAKELNRSKTYLSNAIKIIVSLVGCIYNSDIETSEFDSLGNDELLEIVSSDENLISQIERY